MTHQALHPSAAKHNSALYCTKATRNCEPTPGSLISTCSSAAAAPQAILERSAPCKSSTPGSRLPLALLDHSLQYPPASRPLSAHAVSPPKSTLSTIRKKPASQPASGAVPCRSRQNHHQACPQPQGVSALHSSRPVNFPSHTKTWQPRARQGTHHAPTRLLLDAFPHPSFEAGQNSQPACPAPSPRDVPFVPTITS